MAPAQDGSMKEVGWKTGGRKGASKYFGGGLDGRCKVRCGHGLRRELLLDGVFEEGCFVEVVLGEGVRSIGCGGNGVSLGSHRVGKWSVAIR